MSSIQEKIKEMLSSKMADMQALGKTLQEEENLKSRLHLGTAKKMQEAHPEVVIGGSLALYLHGVRLRRWKVGASDLDMICPYYILFKNSTLVCDKSSTKSDFDQVIHFDNINVDIRIDPKRRYEIITMDDFDFKVTPLEVIWEAKCRYALGGNLKHRNDLLDLCGKLPDIVEPVHQYTWDGS